MFRFKILQMRLEHPEEKIDIIRRLRNFENPLVSASRTGICWFVLVRIRKSDPQSEFLGDQIDPAQPERELLQKSAEHKEQRLGGFDLVIELETFLKRFRRLNEFQQAIRLTGCAFPRLDRFRPEPGPKVFLIQRSELSKRVNPPFVQDGQDRGEWKLGA